MRMSHTPVREALACLCGEGVIERAPNEGFLYPRLDVGVIRDRLRFRATLLSFSLDALATVQVEFPQEAPHLLAALPRHLARLVRAHGNVALYEAYRRVTGQLAPLRDSERRVLAALEAEAADLLAALATGDLGRGQAAIAAYHERRMIAAPHLLLDMEARRSGAEERGG